MKYVCILKNGKWKKPIPLNYFLPKLSESMAYRAMLAWLDGKPFKYLDDQQLFLIDLPC